MRSNMYIKGTSIILCESEVALTASCIINLLCGALEKCRGIACLLFITFVSLLLFSPEAYSQNKWYSTSSRNGGEGAKAQAQISALSQNAIAQSASITTNENDILPFKTCAAIVAPGAIYIPNNELADANGCVDASSIGGSTNPQYTEDTTTACDGSTEGLTRWNASTHAPQVCNGTAWLDMTVAAPLLRNGLSVHSETQCAGLGGSVYNTGAAGTICRFSGSSCPGGWTKFSNWSTTQSVHHICDPGLIFYCDTGGHSFSNTATEYCHVSCWNPNNGCYPYTCSLGDTGSASVTEVGCY